MPSLPFQKNLLNAVMSGAKPGTVRQVRVRNPIKPGDTLYIFTGMRTNKCKRHGQHQCVAVYPIEIDPKANTITLNGVKLIPIIRHWFATTDIQGSEQEFFDFFKRMDYKRPLVYICWSEKVKDMIDQWLIKCRTSMVFHTLMNGLAGAVAPLYVHGRPLRNLKSKKK